MRLESRLYQMENILDPSASTCATMALETILPHKPKPAHIEVAKYNTDIGKLAFLAYYELAEKGIIPEIITKDQSVPPSRFFSELHRSFLQGPKIDRRFYGALLKTTDQKPGLGEIGFRYVITILKLHKGQKATIMDTYTFRRNREKPLRRIRKVPLATLDRRIDNSSPSNCIAIFGYPIFREIIPYMDPDDIRYIRQQLNTRKQKDQITLAEVIGDAKETKSLIERVIEKTVNPQNLSRRALRHRGKFTSTQQLPVSKDNYSGSSISNHDQQ